MAHEIPVQKLSANAGADLSANQYQGVKINANGDVVLAGDGDRIVGILQNKPALNQVAEIMVKGESPAVYGTNITAGNTLQMNAAGKFIVAGAGVPVAIARATGVLDEQHTVVLL